MIKKSNGIPVVGKGDRYMSLTEVANAIGISNPGANKAIHGPRLDAVEFGGRYWVLMSDAKKFAKETDRKFFDRNKLED